jgi:hypothetical protein
MNRFLLYEGEENIKHLLHGKNYGSIADTLNIMKGRVLFLVMRCYDGDPNHRNGFMYSWVRNSKPNLNVEEDRSCPEWGPSGRSTKKLYVSHTTRPL